MEVLRPCRTRFCGGSRVDGCQKHGEQKLLKAIEKDEIYVESEFSNDIPRLWPKLFPTTTSCKLRCVVFIGIDGAWRFLSSYGALTCGAYLMYASAVRRCRCDLQMLEKNLQFFFVFT